MESRYDVVGGLRLHSRVAGSGPPAVMVHGLAVSSRYFVRLGNELGSTHACAALDLPGFGHSEEPGTVLDFPQLADALADWLRATRRSGAVLIGNSAGCQVVAECAARHPDVTGPVVLLGPTVDPSARSLPRQLGRLVTTGLTPDAVQAPLLVSDTIAAGARRIAVTTRFMLGHRIDGILPKVVAPVLVVRGAWDPICPQDWAEAAARLAPRGCFSVIGGAAHLAHLTKAGPVARVIRQFLAVTAPS